MSRRGEINGWVCDRCGQGTYVIHVDDGVTPMFLACRASGDPDRLAEQRGVFFALPGCEGLGTSLMYPSDPPAHVLAAVGWEWYTPDPNEKTRLLAEPEILEHVEKGGLLLRELTEAGLGALEKLHHFHREAT